MTPAGGTDQRNLDLIQLATPPLPVFLYPTLPRGPIESDSINGLAHQAMLHYLANAGGDAQHNDLRGNGVDRSNALFHAMSTTSGGVGRVCKLHDVTDESIRCSSGKPNTQQTVALATAFVTGRRPVRSTWTPAADLTSPRYLDQHFTLSIKKLISTQARESAFASFHRGDANILFADGKVQFISENVDLANIWNLLVSPNGQELVGEF